MSLIPSIKIKNNIPEKTSPTPTNLFSWRILFSNIEIPKIAKFASKISNSGRFVKLEQDNNDSKKLNPKLSNQKNEISKIDEIGFGLLVCAINIFQK